MPRALGLPPNQRPNWGNLHRGKRLYAYREYNKARARRGLIPVPFPEGQPVAPYQPEVEPITSPEPSPSPAISEVPSVPDNFFDSDGDFDEAQLFQTPPRNDSPLFSQGESPFRASVPDIPDSDDDYPPDAQIPPNMSQNSGTVQNSQVSSGSGQPPPPKRPRTGKGAKLPGTAGGQGGGIDTAGENPEPIPRPFISPQTEVRVYKKVHRFITFGLAYTPISVERTIEDLTHNDVFMVTPMAEIPWDRLFMYMNPSEYNLLPDGARVTHMSCTVRSENVRIAFPTNASTSNLATLNQNKFLRVGHGLKQTLGGVNIKPLTFTSDKPMIVETIQEQKADGTDYADYVTNFYGSPNDTGDAAVFAKQAPRHQLGLPYPVQYYYAMVTQDTDPTKSGWPCFQSFVEEMEADSRAGENVVHVDYEPQMGIIKYPLQAIWTGLPSTSTGTATIKYKDGTGNHQGRIVSIDVSGAKLNKKAETFSDWNQNVTAEFDLQQIIEKSQEHIAGLAPSVNSKTVPSLHVGLQPVIALTSNSISNDAVNNYTDAQGYFEVVCECHVDTAYPTYRPHATVANTKPGSMVWEFASTAELPAINKSMFNGLYQAKDAA